MVQVRKTQIHTVMKDELQLIDWLKNNWYQPYTGVLLPLITIVAAEKFLSWLFGLLDVDFSTSLNISLVCAFIISFSSFVFWLHSRRYPKGNPTKVTILIAVRENSEEAKRVKMDVIDKFRTVISDVSEDTKLEIIVLKDHLARKIIDSETATIASNKTNSQFVVWGKSMEYGKNYSFDLHYIVRHIPLDDRQKQIVAKGFTDALIEKKWGFVIDDVFTGIRVTANNIKEVAFYVMGIAAFLSKDLTASKDLHVHLYDVLKNDVAKRNAMPPIFRRLPDFISDTFMISALREYFSGNAETGFYLNEEALRYKPTNYAARLNKAMFLFQGGDTKGAFDLIRSLRKENAKRGIQDSAWRYSEAFLILLEDKYERAYKLYIRAFEGYVDDSTINSVISFIESYYSSNPDKKSLLYIIGLIFEKNQRNSPMAFEWYERFLTESSGDDKYSFFIEKANQSLPHLKAEMGID